MSKSNDMGTGGKAALAGAIGSAAVAAALLYVRRRKQWEERKPFLTPTGEQPETD